MNKKGQRRQALPSALSGLRFLIRYRWHHYAFTRRFRIRRWQIHQLRQNARQFQAHFRTTDDHVDRAFLDQEFTALESWRQFFANGLFDNSRTGKAN